MTTEARTFKQNHLELSNQSQEVEQTAAKAVTANANTPIKTRDIAVVILIAFIWGVAFVGMKETVKYAAPLTAAGLRFFIASLPLLFVVWRSGRLRGLHRNDYVKFAVLGFFQTTLLFGINFTAIQFVPAGISSILLNTNPFFVALFAHFLIKGDGLTKQKILGLLVGFGGVLALVFGGGSSLGDVPVYWLLILLVASVVWATSSILVKLLRFEDMLTASAGQMFFGSLPLLFAGLVFESQPINFTPSFIFWLLYIAIPGSAFGWWAWNSMLQRYSASRISVFLFLIPVFGVLSGVVLLGESLSFSMLIGGALVASGIILVNMRLNRQKALNN